MGESDRPVVSVVDDDESLRRSLRNLLRSVGFGVETFASAEEFLRSAQRENTGCLVLDLRMTGMSGLDLLRRSEEHTSELQSRLHLVCRLLLEKKKQYDASSPVQYRRVS